MVNEVSNVGAVPGAYGHGYEIDPLDIEYGYGDYSMNGSIFNGYANPMCGGNMQGYYDNMKQNQRFWVDYNVDQQNMNRNADLRINASIESVKGAAAILKDKVLANEQDQIQDAFNNYVQTVRAAYGEGTDAEIKSRALSLYTQMNGGKTLYQDLRENSHGSATQGFIQSLTFGLYDRKSAEDNISAISGAPVGTGEKTAHNLGRVAGSVAVGSIAGGIMSALGKGKAGIVGLCVGAAAALMSFITGKVTT